MDIKQCIILIDDNPIWLETLAEFLRGKDLKVLTASDGSEGLVLLDRHGADLVICDYHLPGMDGIDFIG